MMNILAIRSGKIASGKAEVIDGIQQIGFTGAIFAGKGDQPMVEIKAGMLIGAKVLQHQAMHKWQSMSGLCHQGSHRHDARSDPHRHQDIKGVRAFAVLHQGRRTGIREFEKGGIAIKLVHDVEQVTRIEADFERAGFVIHFHFFRRRARVGIGDRQGQLAIRNGELYRPSAFRRDGGHTVNRCREFRFVSNQNLVIAGRDDPLVLL